MPERSPHPQHPSDDAGSHHAISVVERPWSPADVLSVQAAASRLPWRRSVAVEWLEAAVPIRRGPGDRRFIVWSDVLDALAACEPVNDIEQSNAPTASTARKPAQTTFARGHQWLND